MTKRRSYEERLEAKRLEMVEMNKAKKKAKRKPKNYKKPPNYWSKAKVYKEAKKYPNRVQFYKSARGAFDHAKREGYLNEMCLDIYGKPYERTNTDHCVYMILFDVDDVRYCYIGRTCSFNGRIREHNIKKCSAVYQFKKKYKLKKSNFKIQLTDYLPQKEAAHIERLLIKFIPVILPWKMINKVGGEVVKKEKES